MYSYTSSVKWRPHRPRVELLGCRFRRHSVARVGGRRRVGADARVLSSARRRAAEGEESVRGTNCPKLALNSALREIVDGKNAAEGFANKFPRLTLSR